LWYIGYLLVVEHILHNAEVVVHYVIMSFYILCMGIHADWYPTVNI